MSKRFDPYHAWLGIPSHEQPPNHYRLLGISVFESDDDVIQNGLNQRTAYLRTLVSGDHAEEARHLLAEISRAGVCLLRPEKKRVYDRQLKSALQADAETVLASAPLPPASPAPARQPMPSEPAPMPAAVPPESMPMPAAVPQSPVGHKPAAAFPYVPVVAGGIIGSAIALLVLLLFAPGGTDSEKVVQIDLTTQNSDHSAGLAEEANAVDEPATTNEATDPPGSEVTSPPQTPPGPALPAEQTRPEPEATPVPTNPQTPPGQPGPLPMGPGNSAIDPPVEPDSQEPPPASWPRPLPGSPMPNQTTSPFPLDITPPNNNDPFASPPGAETPAKAEGTPKSIVLDLEKSTMHVPLAEQVEGKEVQVKVMGFKDFSEPYALEPFDGILTLEQPVDILLNQYAGVRIRLSLDEKGEDIELLVAPEIETEEGDSVDFSKRKIDNAKRAMIKNGNNLGKQLDSARAEALALQNAMSTPAPAPLRNAQRQRYNTLIAQIPQIQNQLVYVQSRQQVLQQFSFLVKQLHEKATINLVIQTKPPNEVE